MLGCQSEEEKDASDYNKKVVLSPQELMCISYENSPELTQNEIFDLVSEFHSKITHNNTRSDNHISSLTIKRKYYFNTLDSVKKSNTRSLKNEGQQIPICEVHFSSNGEKGMAIVSADKRSPHILAYINKIKDTKEESSLGPNVMLALAKACITSEVKYFESIKDSLQAVTMAKISKTLNITTHDFEYDKIKNKIIVENNNTRSTPIAEIPENLEIKSGTGPLCPSTWDQLAPYNCKLPMDNCEIIFPGWVEYTNYPTGCAPVAIAHLMACVEPALTLSNININWGYLTENPRIIEPDYFNPGDPLDKREMVGLVFREIYDKIGSYPTKNSNNYVKGSTATVNNTNSYIKSFFSCSQETSWSTSLVKRSLRNGNPVYVYGAPEGNGSTAVYTFILDGIRECWGRINNVPRDIDITYIHANFGFGGGSQDGYYLMELDNSNIVFETSIPLIFKTSALTIISEIKRK